MLSEGICLEPALASETQVKGQNPGCQGLCSTWLGSGPARSPSWATRDQRRVRDGIAVNRRGGGDRSGFGVGWGLGQPGRGSGETAGARGGAKGPGSLI
jgi:hypothetical protein